MSNYKPSEGDRVRVVLEGEVTSVNRTYWYIDNHWGVDDNAPSLVSVEKIAEPLPTTPGSVLKGLGSGDLYLRGQDGWVDEHGTYMSPSTGPSDPTNYKVIFDAGKAS